MLEPEALAKQMEEQEIVSQRNLSVASRRFSKSPAIARRRR